MDVLLLVLSVLPSDGTLTDQVDRVEVNHFYDGKTGAHVFDQIIWWNWNTGESRFDVVAWRLLKDVRKEMTIDDRRLWERMQDDRRIRGLHYDPGPAVGEWVGGHAVPLRRGRFWVSEWHDEKCNRRRRVVAGFRIETWTIIDPEIVAREVLAQEKRKGLTRVSRSPKGK